MWIELMEVKNRYVAEMWRELFAAEALSVQIVPQSGWGKHADLEPYKIYVPRGKLHVAQEILRKV
jgi:hypothetical protein